MGGRRAGEGRGDWRGQGITVARLFWCFNAGPGLRLCLAPAGKVVWFFAHDVGCKAVSRPRGQGGAGGTALNWGQMPESGATRGASCSTSLPRPFGQRRLLQKQKNFVREPGHGFMRGSRAPWVKKPRSLPAERFRPDPGRLLARDALRSLSGKSVPAQADLPLFPVPGGAASGLSSGASA